MRGVSIYTWSVYPGASIDFSERPAKSWTKHLRQSFLNVEGEFNVPIPITQKFENKNFLFKSA